MRHYVLTTSGDIVVCFHTDIRQCVWVVNYVMAFSICYWANYTQGKRSYPGSQKTPWWMTGFWSFCIWRRLTSCWILSAMSPEIQVWSH